MVRRAIQSTRVYHHNASGKAVDGPLKGASLTYVFSFISEWYGWSAYHPETAIYEG